MRSNPDEATCVRQPLACLATHDRNGPGVPGEFFGVYSIGNARAIRREHWTHLFARIVRQLNRLAVWEKFHVDLSRGNKGSCAANKYQHSPIRGQCGLCCGIRESCDLLEAQWFARRNGICTQRDSPHSESDEDCNGAYARVQRISAPSKQSLGEFGGMRRDGCGPRRG